MKTYDEPWQPKVPHHRTNLFHVCLNPRKHLIHAVSLNTKGTVRYQYEYAWVVG